MLQEHDIEIKLKCQQYSCESYIRNEDESESVFLFESKQKTDEVSCPHCGGRVNISGLTSKHLKDLPLWEGMKQDRVFQRTEAGIFVGLSHTASVPRTLRTGLELLIDSEPEETCGPQQRSHR